LMGLKGQAKDHRFRPTGRSIAHCWPAVLQLLYSSPHYGSTTIKT
jgi:hypothetical protein